MKREINDFSKHFFCLVNLCESQSVADTQKECDILSELERDGESDRRREGWNRERERDLENKGGKFSTKEAKGLTNKHHLHH